MECPHCHNDKALPVKDRLAVEPVGSELHQKLHPGDRPSGYGTLFLLGGGASMLTALVLWNARPFRDAFFDFNWVHYGRGLPCQLNPAGWLILAVLVVGGLVACGRGMALKGNFQKNVGSWERKQRFFESGVVCAACRKVWLPGLEDHPQDLQ